MDEARLCKALFRNIFGVSGMIAAVNRHNRKTQGPFKESLGPKGNVRRQLLELERQWNRVDPEGQMNEMMPAKKGLDARHSKTAIKSPGG